MLIEFRVANHRSLRDEQVLTMEAGRVGDDADPRPRQIPGHSEKLLTVAGLYGANASGKSNVLGALAFMNEAIQMSHRSWEPNQSLPRDPFAWGSKKTEPSLFEVTFLLDNIRFQYGFLASNERFLEEWLYAWPNGKKQVWFERDNIAYKFGENLRGENKLIENITRPNALFLSAAAQHNHQQLQPIFSWFRSLRSINLSIGQLHLYRRWADDFLMAELLDGDALRTRSRESSPERKPSGPRWECFGNLLKNADVGIVDWRVEKNEADHDDPTRTIYLKHQNSKFDSSWLPLEEESQGTRTLFHIAWPFLQTIQKGGVLLMDELERSLHPSLARQIIHLFNDPKANPNNAQIIFTTHDTNLLGSTVGEPALRRDQVWLTEKNAEGATALYPLTDYKPRKAENLERGYLQGRYGAIPFLGDFLVTAE
jgi:uncharacterized protein